MFKPIPLLIIFALFSMTIPASAQKLFFVFGHAEYASTVGKLSDTHSEGIGFEAGAGLGVKKTFFTATTGYTWLSQANGTLLSSGRIRYMPIKFGIRRFVFLKNLFVKGNVGMASLKYKDVDKTNSQFTYDLGAGLKFSRLEIVGDFTHTEKLGSWIGLKAGFNFGL